MDTDASASGGSAKARAGRRVADWLVVVGVFAAYIALNKFVPPRIHPIDLSDPRVRRPLLPEIVPTYVLGLMVLLLPVATFCALEICQFLRRPRVFFIGAFGAFFLGLCEAVGFTVLLTGGLKLAVGRPRPFFRALCVAYEAGSHTACVGDGRAETAAAILEARKSFPSGHSSLSFAAFIYLALYMARRLDVRRPGTPFKTLKYLILGIPLCLAAFVAVSRIVDNHHNFDDVVAGSCLGAGIAVAVWAGRCEEIELCSQPHSEERLPLTAKKMDIDAPTGAGPYMTLE